MAKSKLSLDEELAREANRTRLLQIIKPLPRPGYSCDFSMLNLRRNLIGLLDSEDELEITPDFQRGVVWSQEKQIYFVECMLRDLLPKSAYNLTFNMPYFSNPIPPKTQISTKYTNFICIDGLQRFNTIENFIRGEFKVFENQVGIQDLRFTAFDLARKTFTINVFEYDTTQDILNLYLNMNTGGIAHADSEIQRVKNLLEQEITKQS